MQDSLSNARRTTPAFVLALALLGASGFGGWKVWQQVRMAPGTSVALDALAPLAASRSSDMRPASSKAVARGPGWEQLDTPQKLALYPLAPRWAALGEQQKRQWLLIAQSFSQLPEAEQERLHNRMTEWASLSAQQRSQARLNYAATKRLAPDSKRAQWEAYQALSSDEKKRLAAAAAATAHRSLGASPAVRPVLPRKLAKVPAATANPTGAANLPKVENRDNNARLRPVMNPAPAPDTRPILVETAPVVVPSASPQPLPPLDSSTPSTAAPVRNGTVEPMPPDMASQYSH